MAARARVCAPVSGDDVLFSIKCASERTRFRNGHGDAVVTNKLFKPCTELTSFVPVTCETCFETTETGFKNAKFAADSLIISDDLCDDGTLARAPNRTSPVCSFSHSLLLLKLG